MSLLADTESALAVLRRMTDDPNATPFWRRQLEEMARHLVEGAVLEERIRAARPPALEGVNA